MTQAQWDDLVYVISLIELERDLGESGIREYGIPLPLC